MDSLSYEYCFDIAKKYTRRKAMMKDYPEVIGMIIKMHWENEMFSHMDRPTMRKTISYEDCEKEVKKYKKLKELKTNNINIYNSIIRYRWYELLDGLEREGGIYDRTIYAYEFPELNHVYVGLTWNIDIRNAEHHKRGTLYNFTKKHNIIEFSPIIKEEKVIWTDAGKLEEYYINQYKENGWQLINKAKAGSVGGVILKRENIVLFNLSGDYIENTPIDDAISKYGLKLRVVRMCLRKTNKSTNGYQILSEEEWINMGSPNKITEHNIKNIEEEVLLLDNHLKPVKVFKTKRDILNHFGSKPGNNTISMLKHQQIVHISKQKDGYRCCYYDDYKKYEDGLFELYHPNRKKCRKLLFLEKGLSIEEKEKQVDKLLELPDFQKHNYKMSKIRRSKYKKQK